MRILIKVVAVIVVLSAVAYAFRLRTRGGPIPSIGSYRIADATPRLTLAGITDTPGGKVAIIEVDYQGPKEWAEIVIENWDGPKLVDTQTVMRMKFGSDRREEFDWGTNFTNGPAFLHQRQIYSIWLDELPEVLSDGRNVFAKVVEADPGEPDVASNHSAVIRVAAATNLEAVANDGRTYGSTSFLSQTYKDGEVRIDKEASEIWLETRFVKGGEQGHKPPYPEGVTASRMLFRLRT